MEMKKTVLLSLIGILTLSFSCTGNFKPLPANNTATTFSNNESPVLSKPAVKKIPSPNRNPRPENTKINAVILHHTAGAGTAEQVAKFFANPNAKVSAHYTVDRTGYIVQSVDDRDRSWHAGRSEFHGVPNVNDYSIGIEICNLGDSMEPYPETQYDGLIRLVAFLVKHYEIPLENITRHRDIAIPAGRKIDTSNNFSVEKVMNGVKAMLAGNYNPPDFPIPQPIDYPRFKEVKVQKGDSSFAILAEKYLDNEHRAEELELVNTHIKNPDNIPAGTKVKIPTGYEFFYQLHR